MNYLIARVSDVSQRKALPAQMKKLFDYAKKEEWVEGKDFKYIEYDETAYKVNRPKFNQLIIEPLKAEKSLAIVVFDKIDRFSRESTSDERKALHDLFKKGKIELHFPSDGLYISKDSPAHDLFRLDIGVALAAYYSSAIRDNVKRRFSEMLSKGHIIGKAPLGYENYVKQRDDNGNPTEKGVRYDVLRKDKVHEAFELRSIGWSYGAIAKKMKEDGLMNKPRKNKYGKKVATFINKGKWQEIINNPFYIGEMNYMGGEYFHDYGNLIEPWLWDKCQRINRDRRVRHTKLQGKPFLFKKLKCGVEGCGCTITFDGPKGKGGYVYGKCTNYYKVHEPISVNENVLIEQVKDILRQITVPKELLPTIVDEVKKNHSAEQNYYRKLKQSLQDEHEKLDGDIRRMFEERETYSLRMDIFDKMVQEKTVRQNTILQELEDLTEGNKGFVIGASYILELSSRAVELFESDIATIEQKRYLIDTVLSNMQFDGKNLTFTLVEPFGAIAKLSENRKWCG
jgi:site-specific DNA recombinase